MRVSKEFPVINMRSFKFRTGIDKFLVLKHLSTKFCLKNKCTRQNFDYRPTNVFVSNEKDNV